MRILRDNLESEKFKFTRGAGCGYRWRCDGGVQMMQRYFTFSKKFFSLGYRVPSIYQLQSLFNHIYSVSTSAGVIILKHRDGTNQEKHRFR